MLAAKNTRQFARLLAVKGMEKGAKKYGTGVDQEWKKSGTSIYICY